MPPLKNRRNRFLKNSIVTILLTLLLLAAAALGADGRESAKFIFLFIGDGMGEAQVQADELYSLASGRGGYTGVN